MRDRIHKLVKEALTKPPKKGCNCGCDECDKAPILNENIQSRIIMTENMKYHIDGKKPLIENTFRYGSKAFLDLWAEARYLYSRDAIDLSGMDKQIVTETHLGEYGLYNGKRVPLDMPMVEEYTPSPQMNKSLLESLIKKTIQETVNEAEYQGKKVDLGKPKRGGSKKFYVYVMNPKTKKVKKVSFGAAGGGQNLAVKIRDPKARRAFAKRQNCDKKKDRTTPGYWSCNLPRYANILGLKGSFSGYW
jgi:hypothetical protein